MCFRNYLMRILGMFHYVRLSLFNRLFLVVVPLISCQNVKQQVYTPSVWKQPIPHRVMRAIVNQRPITGDRYAIKKIFCKKYNAQAPFELCELQLDLEQKIDFFLRTGIAHLSYETNNIKHDIHALIKFIESLPLLESIKLTDKNGLNITTLSLAGCRLDGAKLQLLLSKLADGTKNNLKVLDLSNNELSAIKLPSFFQLRKLDLRGNNLRSISITDLQELEHFDLVNESLGAIELPHLPRLRLLNLANNLLETIEMPHLPQLEDLDLAYNQLKSANLINLHQLHNLYLNNNKLTRLNLSNLPELRELHLNNNAFGSFIPLPVLPRLREIFLDSKVCSINLPSLTRIRKHSF